MMVKKYPKNYHAKAGEFIPHGVDMQWQCCDCGLVHNVTFRLDTLLVKMTRNKKATAAARRKKGGVH